jgi:AcrR family transcriptional regulator
LTLREAKSSERKAATRKKLVDSAVKLFSENWYEGISIAEICRNTNLSNGVFYRYYRNKEDIFREILDGFLDRIQERFDTIRGVSVRDRLLHFFSLVEYSNKSDVPYINIFREGEFRHPEYEQRLRLIYQQALYRIFGRTISIAGYLYVVGSLRFLIRRPFFREGSFSGEDYADIILGGVFSPEPGWRRSCLDLELSPVIDDWEGADTRTRLILAGKQLIAQYGFQKVNIYEITRSAGFAVGTFYIHFQSKEQYFAEVVRYLNKSLRTYLAGHLDGRLSRLEQELQGWMLFLNYFETHTQNYQLVREAEFVVREAVQHYYDKFEQGYLNNLVNSNPSMKSHSPVAKANFLIGIAHHLGIEYFFSKNIQAPVAVVSEIAQFLQSGIT